MKAWYSYKSKRYSGNCPPYYHLEGTGWYDKLVGELPLIKETAISFLNDPGSWQNTYFNTDIVVGTNWESVSLLYWGPNQKVVPIKKELSANGQKLLNIFKDIPGIVTLSVSILQPHTHLKPHCGDTDAVYRLHIPIIIPCGLPECGIRVGGIETAWTLDNILVFCDAHTHEAWNHSDKARVILIIDVLKEDMLPFKKTVCQNVLSLLELQKLNIKYRFVKRSPGWVQGIIRHLLFYRIMFFD